MAQKLKFGNGTWATKEGSTLAYNDENNNFKPLPFSFTRNSIATRVNKEGLIEVVGKDKPRIDYTDSADGVLLLENSSTNLFPYSEDFSSSDWTKSNSSIVSNSTISPDGTQSAETFSITSNFGFFYKAPSLASGATVTQSIFVKNINADRINLQVRTASTAGLASFFFDNSEITSVTLTNGISADFDYYGDGWYRVYLTCQTTETNQLFRFQLNESGMSCYIWGAQVEQQSYATSYIPTSGSSVTRAAETCNGAGNSEVFNDSEGVLFADVSFNLEDNYPNLSIFNNTNATKTDNKIVIYKGATNSNQISVALRSGGSEYANITANVNVENYNKIVISYKANEVKYYLNGFLIGTDNTVTVPIGLDTLNFDNGAGANDVYGKTKELGYYDTALTDEELEYLTSYRSLNELVTELNLNTL